MHRTDGADGWRLAVGVAMRMTCAQVLGIWCWVLGGGPMSRAGGRLALRCDRTYMPYAPYHKPRGTRSEQQGDRSIGPMGRIGAGVFSFTTPACAAVLCQPLP
jgi:hypothetical protein